MSYILPEDWKPSNGILLDEHSLNIARDAKSRSILAGPGAGKTELLAQRANFLLTTGTCPHPRRILALAFKVDAARNLQERVAARCTPALASRFESLTLHGFAKRVLDQFLEALPPEIRPTANYRIFSPNRDTWNAFRIAVSDDIPSVSNFNDSQLYKLVHSTPSGDLFGNVTNDIRTRWWKFCVRDTSPSTMTFEMVMLLALKIIETQKIIVSALRQTYSHVFLDEFQDVTELQYRLFKAIFQGSDAVITAVGDTNQAIMAWAGALPDVFEKFNSDFYATGSKLLLNFRSNRAVVNLINAVASMFETNPVLTHSARENDPVPPNPVEGWVFDSRDAEADFLAKFIKSELDNGRTPEDFVILARLRVDRLEDRLREHFANTNVPLRNESRKIGSLEIQDLGKERAFQFIMSTLKMAANVRVGDPFQVCRDTIADLEGLDIASERGSAQSLRAVQSLTSDLGELLRQRDTSGVGGKEILQIVMPASRHEQFGRVFPEYKGNSHLSEVLVAFAGFFDECARQKPDWKGCIDLIEGRGVVKLMTIHKSKGLEFQTVIFVELNDDAFWKSADDANIFLVALSRARERIKFSFAKDSKGFNNVRDFIDQLEKAGVPFVSKP